MGQHDLPAAVDILRYMLAVGIRGDTAPHIRPGAQTIIEGVLQGPAFPHIYIVGQNGTAQLHGLRVQAVISRTAAVIDDHDLIFIFRCQPAQQRDHPLVRFIGRNDQRNDRPLPGRGGSFFCIGHTMPSLFAKQSDIPYPAAGGSMPRRPEKISGINLNVKPCFFQQIWSYCKR